MSIVGTASPFQPAAISESSNLGKIYVNELRHINTAGHSMSKGLAPLHPSCNFVIVCTENSTAC